MRFRRHIGASDLILTPQFSPALAGRQSPGFTLLGSVNNGDGTETAAFRSVQPAATSAFGQVELTRDP